MCKVEYMYFDIGANIGRWSLSNVPSCADKIIAVEASPTTFTQLVSNCGSSPKIVPLNFAVCNSNTGTVIFYDASESTISTINKKWLSDESSRFYNYAYNEIVCKTITIDKLIAEYGLPDLIKIDVEGGEYECISSLTQKVNMLCFEWASETNDISHKCLDHLISLGFSEFCIQRMDDYTYRPRNDEFVDVLTVKQQLGNTTPKVDWGMIWCR